MGSNKEEVTTEEHLVKGGSLRDQLLSEGGSETSSMKAEKRRGRFYTCIKASY